jgi:hypothetical protein
MFAQSANILYQQMMLVLLLSLLASFMTSVYLFLVGGIFFWLTHAPVLLTGIKYRKQYFIASLIGGLAMSLLIVSFESGYLFSYTLHYLFYFLLSLHVKNEAII